MKALQIVKSKIVEQNKLLAISNRWGLKGEKIVFTNGCFDILHQGHVDYLSKAADMGSKLVVGVNTDDSVRRLGKDTNRPIQDENSRTSLPRPFPFRSTHDPRHYSSLLNKKSNRPVITYKSVAQSNNLDFNEWANEAWLDYGVREIVLVGSPSQRNSLSLPLGDAYKTLVANENDFFIGGITIAERHATKGNEHTRLIEKHQQGCNFFISQAKAYIYISVLYNIQI